MIIPTHAFFPRCLTLRAIDVIKEPQRVSVECGIRIPDWSF